MRTQSVVRRRSLVEILEARRLLASAGRLLEHDFNATTAWPTAAAVSSAGVDATATQAAVGTIDVESGTLADRTGAVHFGVSAAPATGPWKSDFTSGKLALTNTETNLGKLTVSFNLSASQARTVKLRVISYDAGGLYTGALESEISPAVANSYHRHAVDLSTMKESGPGTFNPTAPKVSFNFEIGSVAGWSASGTPTLRIDNFNYSKPALYVSSIDGNDRDNGTTEALAVRTLQRAFNLAQPGDIILVKGDAANPYNILGERTLVTEGGTPAAWVSLKNYPGQTPKIYSEAWSAIQIGAFSNSTAPAIGYVEIRGLHFQGGSAKVGSRTAPDGNYNPAAPNADQYGPYAQYLQDVDPVTGRNTSGSADPRTNGNGISVDGGRETNKPHDIRIADNLVEDFAGGGIGAGDSDRIQIENNVVRDNCYWDKYATSGISILSVYSFDATSGTTTRLIRNNVSSGNIHKIVWVRNDPALTQYSDGNGIIIDINGTIDDRTLVQNNVTFDNGGSGIHAYKGNHVDIVNNTAYLNSSSPYLDYGQIFANQAVDVKIYNNIMVAPVANTAAGEQREYVSGGTTPSSSNGIVYKNNVYFGGNVNGFANNGTTVVNNVTADPRFANPTVNAALADFRLQPSSPAVYTGLADALTPQKDLLGNVRNGSVHSGAYEYYAATPTVVTAAAATPAPVTGRSTELSVIAGDNDGPAALTYTWSTTAKPAGAVDPTFDRNGAATSKTAVVTFSKAGTYSLLVTVRDAGNATRTSAVSVVVSPTLSGLAVTPSDATVAAGGERQYGVSGLDQFGQPMAAGAVTWSTVGSGTSITASGLLTASATTGPFEVTALSGGFTASAQGAVTDQTAPTLLSAVSRKTHGAAGVFDLSLALSGTPTVEPRIGGGNTLVFTFAEPIIASDGLLDASEFLLSNATFDSATLSGVELTLRLSNVIDQARTGVTFQGVTDASGNTLAGTAGIMIRSLYGDANRTGVVNSTDIALVKRASGQIVNNMSYLLDLNASGTLNSTDIALIKRLSGHSVN